MQEKSKFLSVRLTAEEREHLDRLARESGLSLSNVIRSCINRTEIRQRQPAEINDLYREIAGVYKDYMSGRDLRRPGLQFLEQQAAEKKMDYILSCKRDRIYRGHDLRGLLRYEDRMHTLGVDILYPFEQD